MLPIKLYLWTTYPYNYPLTCKEYIKLDQEYYFKVTKTNNITNNDKNDVQRWHIL